MNIDASPPEAIRLDRTGILLTTICAVHCLAMPFLIVVAPVLIPMFLGLHKYLAWAVAPVAVLAAVQGWTKHRRVNVVMLLLGGAALISSACTWLLPVLWERGIAANETVLTCIGGLILVAGHWMNYRFSNAVPVPDNRLPDNRLPDNRLMNINRAVRRSNRYSWSILATSGLAIVLALCMPLRAPTMEAYQRVSFRTLRLYLPGNPPPTDVRSLNNRKVEIMGFMAALNQLEDIDEFVLASAPPMNCFCHPPGQVNELVLVEMKKGSALPSYKGGVVRVRGVLKISMNIKLDNQYLEVMYTIVAEEVL